MVSERTNFTSRESRPRLQSTRDLSSAERTLLAIMTKHQFGRIENILVRAGQPVLDHGVKVVRVTRLAGESAGTRSIGTDEFELKRAVRDLFAELARLENGLILKLEFRHGLPFLLETGSGVTDGR
jgi:hypothetical protein